ncbi:MAG TPA: dynamin family protein [Polyangia bacterium]|nr:dynamin family protein [Polyangia bacterium]
MITPVIVSTDIEARARQLMELYQERLRPWLTDYIKGDIVSLDQAAAVVGHALERKTRLAIGFVGESQVGKSSLINALLGRSALPSGGIGPLTAQATQVRYAEEDRLEVAYHGRAQVRGMRLILEKGLARKGELTLAAADPEPKTEGAEAGETRALARGLEVELLGPRSGEGGEGMESDTEARQEAEERFQYMLDQAWSMLGGVQPHEAGSGPARPPNAVLVDGLRAILGEPVRKPEALVAFQANIEEVRRKLSTTETITASSAGGAGGFERALRSRATGHLAPLVRELTVGLHSDFARTFTLVDLPGIGVQGDPGALVAEQFVADGGDALVVVMRNSGLTDAVARLLERTQVITRLLMEGDTPTPVHVMIAVTHLDDVAKTRYQEAAKAARASGERPPDKHRLFQDLAGQMAEKIRTQVRDALLRSPAFEELGEEQRGRRVARIDALCRAMDVICVSAPDYMALIEGFEEDAFLRDREATNVPVFRGQLEVLARRATEHRTQAIATAEREMCALMDAHLRSIATTYQSGRGKAVTQWESFRGELEHVAQGLREQMKASHGELLAHLQNTLPAQIRLLCREAETGALKKLSLLRRHGEGLPYPSLNAALRRGGVWGRRNINYPEALTMKFVDTIALDWEPRIVEGIRGSIRKGAERDLKLVEALCERAQELDEHIVGDAEIAVQRQILQQKARACIAWTGDRLEKLTAGVRQALGSKIGSVMEGACQVAIRAGANRDRGAKRRILEAFEQGGTEASERAREHAERLLDQHYQALVMELREGYLAEHHDPVTDALRRLTADELMQARRADAAQQEAVLKEVAAWRNVIAPFMA